MAFHDPPTGPTPPGRARDSALVARPWPAYGAVGAEEAAARQLLSGLGARWVACWPNSKVRQGPGNRTTSRIPRGNAEVQLPAELIAFDVDSPEAGEWLDWLRQDWPDTLLLRARRGLRAVYRLPSGVLVRDGLLVQGLEVLHHFLAPGSWYQDVYYTVERLQLPAELPQDPAQAIAELLGTPVVPREGFRTTVKSSDHWDRQGRVRRARGTKASTKPTRDRNEAFAEAQQRWEAWAQETAPVERERKLWKIALSMQRWEQEYETFESFLRGRPIWRAVKDKGDPRRWLTTQFWLKAGRQVAATPHDTRPARSTKDFRERYGVGDVAAPWLRRALARLDEEVPSKSRRNHLRALVQLHASWAAVHGLPYALNRQTMFVHTGLAGKGFMAGLLDSLVEMGLIRRVGAENRRQEQVQQWTLLWDGEDVACSTSFTGTSGPAPASALRLLSDSEVDGLREAARQRDDEEHARDLASKYRKERQKLDSAQRMRVQAAQARAANGSGQVPKQKPEDVARAPSNS